MDNTHEILELLRAVEMCIRDSQKLAQRADVQSHQGAVSYGLPGQTHIGGDDCLRRAAGARQLKGAGPKGCLLYTPRCV